MTFEDFDWLIYDFIGASNMPYHDFKLIWNVYSSKEKDDYIDYFRFNRDIQKQLVSEDGLRDTQHNTDFWKTSWSPDKRGT